LIGAAVAANVDLQLAAARVEEARSAGGIARSGSSPQLEADASAAVSRQPVIVGPSPSALGVAPANIGAALAGPGASWELDVFHRVRLRTREANARLAASEEDRRAVLVALLADVARYYTELRGLQARLELAGNRVRLAEDEVAMSESLAKAGLGTEIESALAAAHLQAAHASIPPLHADVAAAIQRLSVLTGTDAATLQSQLKTASPLPPVPPSLAVGLPSELLTRRPDIRRAEADRTAAIARLGIARAEAFPHFTLTGSAAGQALQLHDFSLGLGIFNVGPSVSVPVLNGGRIRAGVAVEEARVQETQTAWQSALTRALEETEDALARYAQEQDRQEFLTAEVKQRGIVAELAAVQYRAGLTDYSPVLAANRERIDSEEHLLQSKIALVEDTIALSKALGGGWALDTGGR
jgi:NodT family efflux transporter outer membrane factor (OMF) lipoprotein